MHYYQFNIGDYASHTKHLSPTEDICYRRLLDFYYLHEQPIINDLAKVTRLLCLNKEYLTDVEQVLNEFFKLSDDGWINERADKEIKQYQSFKTAGAAGAAKRWAKAGDGGAIGGVSAGQANPNAKHKPLNNNQEPLNIKQEPLKDIRGSRLTNDWEAPQEYILFCNTERPDLDANMIANMFKDYWIGVAGAKGNKNDWFATWRNWVRRQEQGKSKFKNKSAIISDSQFDDWLNSTTSEVQHERLA